MAGNFFQQAFEKTKSIANQAVDSTKCAAQKTKLKSKISSENHNIEKLYTEIGKYYYNTYRNNPDEAIRPVVNNVSQAFANIAELEQEIREVEELEARAMNTNNYNQGMQNQMYNQGMQPQMNQGVQPQMSQGMQPQMNQGVQPQMNQGVQPQMNQGVQPQMNQGVQPQMNQGVQPQMNQGVQPQMNQGVQPQMSQSMDNLFASPNKIETDVSTNTEEN